MIRIAPTLNAQYRQLTRTVNPKFAGEKERQFIKEQLHKQLSTDDERGDLVELSQIEKLATSGDRKQISQHIVQARKSDRKLTDWINKQVAKLGIEKRTGQKPSMVDKKFADHNPHGFTDADFVSAEQLAAPGTEDFKAQAKDILDNDLRGSIHGFLVEKGYSKP